MLLLPTNPILATLLMRISNRRISAGLPSRWPRTHVPTFHQITGELLALDNSPVISTPEFSCGAIK